VTDAEKKELLQMLDRCNTKQLEIVLDSAREAVKIIRKTLKGRENGKRDINQDER